MTHEDLARYEAQALRQLAREVATAIAVPPGHLLELIRMARRGTEQNDQESHSA